MTTVDFPVLRFPTIKIVLPSDRCFVGSRRGMDMFYYTRNGNKPGTGAAPRPWSGIDPHGGIEFKFQFENTGT